MGECEREGVECGMRERGGDERDGVCGSDRSGRNSSAVVIARM